MKNKLNIPAIHDNDLSKVLDELGLLSKIEKGELICLNCSKIITLENLGGLVPRKNTADILCNDPECIASETIKNEQ
jgi:hypothetical protein